MGARRTTVFLSFLFLCQFALGREWVEFYNNTRSLGMGGAAIAVSSDETSLFRNPANLGSIRNTYGTLFDPEMEASSNFVNQVTSNSTAKAFEIEEVNSILDTHRGEYYQARVQISPSVVMRNFGVGLIYKNQLHAVREATGTTMDTFYQSDMGAVIGANYRFFDGRIKVGANAKFINRIEVNNEVLPTSGPFDLETIASEGSALSFDGGVMIQLPWKYLPSIAAVVHDIGDTKFDDKDGVRLRTQSRPATVKQSVDVAAALFPIHSGHLRSVWTVEFHDLADSREDDDTMKRVHAGTEINWGDIFFVRLGVNQRYWTAGFEIAAEKVTWQVASYGEEIGTKADPKEDRRLNTKLTLRF